MSGQQRPPGEHDNQLERDRVIDVTGEQPVVVEESGGFSTFTESADRVRVFVASGDRRTCAIPIIVIILMTCCSCIVLWSLADNLI